jgi:hypothetical protein
MLILTPSHTSCAHRHHGMHMHTTLRILAVHAPQYSLCCTPCCAYMHTRIHNAHLSRVYKNASAGFGVSRTSTRLAITQHASPIQGSEQGSCTRSCHALLQHDDALLHHTVYQLNNTPWQTQALVPLCWGELRPVHRTILPPILTDPKPPTQHTLLAPTAGPRGTRTMPATASARLDAHKAPDSTHTLLANALHLHHAFRAPLPGLLLLHGLLCLLIKAVLHPTCGYISLI